jgi:two-component system sensor histidine kinase KdpD
MELSPFPGPDLPPYARYLAGLCVWAFGWLALALLDGPLDLSSLGMVLVLTAALAALWLPLPVALASGFIAVMAFNWLFVPPRGTFAVDFHQDSAMLFVMFALSAIIAGLMSTLRGQVRQAREQARAADTLRAWNEQLRDAKDARNCLPDLKDMLETFTARPVVLLTLRAGLPAENDMDAVELLGSADGEQVDGLWYALRNGQLLGPMSGRYEGLAELYLPLRGRDMTYGAALVDAALAHNREKRAQMEDLCGRMGVALERQHLQREQELTQRTAREQELRATLLAAISHEYRTPLATIMGAASALEQQDERLDREQRRQLSHRVVEEAARLRQMTANILQLARLDAPGVQVHCDWEAAEELTGALMQRFRTHEQYARLHTEVAPQLPLLWCDSLLMSQLLDNLVDNALKFSTPGTAVHVGARRSEERVILYVRDQGPGVPEVSREAIFQAFRQGAALPSLATAPQGVGLGLPLCRVIAAAHGGELRLDAAASGSCFECVLPLRAQPVSPAYNHVTES